MSYRPNYQGGRRGGGRGRGGGGRGGDCGEQRRRDPVWRAERLRQKAVEMEVLDENEWWGKMEQFKRDGDQELIIRRNYSRSDQQVLSDMAFEFGLHFHAYNKGKSLVVSKVPLPNYREDLDELHGSTQKQIQMSLETERLVGKLLNSSQMSLPVSSSSVSSTPEASSSRRSSLKSALVVEHDSSKEKLNFELRDKQEKLKETESVMKSFREKLPAFKKKTDFLKSVADNQRIKRILCAGLYPNVVQCKRRGKMTAFYTKEVGKVDIHPASVNARVHLFPLSYLVYSEKVETTGIFIWDSTNISDYALLLFGGNFLPSENGDGIEMLGGYLHFSASRSVLDLMQKLRAELDRLLSRKIEDPRLNISLEGKGVVAAAVELLHRYGNISNR